MDPGTVQDVKPYSPFGERIIMPNSFMVIEAGRITITQNNII